MSRAKKNYYNRKRKTQDKNDQQNKSNESTNSKPQEGSNDSGTTNNGESGTSSTSNEGKTGVSATSINDPEWYKKYPELAFGAANLPFSERLGSPVRMGDVSINAYDSQDVEHYFDVNIAKNDSVPGICSLRTKPCYGLNVDLNSPINVAATQFYTNVRYVNSGRKNYDSSDLMISELAIAELFSYINWMERLYGYAYMYSMRNNYINDLLISANHVNVTDITEKLANFRYWINTFISRVSVFAVPSEINIFRRRAFMYAHLYTESTVSNIKDQLYQFVPDGFYKFQLDATGKGMLKYIKMKDFAETKWTLNNIIAFGEALLQNIANDEDFGLISGDIIKAFGSNLLQLTPCPEALVIEPEYEEFTLSQMRNARLVDVQRGSSAVNYKIKGNNDETFTTGDVMQANNGNIITCETFTVDKGSGVSTVPTILAALSGIITINNPNPSIDDVLEATRLITCAVSDAENPYDVPAQSRALYCGSDIVTEWIQTQWIYNNDGTIYQPLEEAVDYQMIWVGNVISGIRRRLDSMHFHWAPMTYLYDVVTINDVKYIKYIDVMSNIDNYTTLSYTNVKNLHEVALISLLSVPGVARLVG